MFNSNAIWSEILLQKLDTTRNFGGPVQSDVAVISERAGLSVNIRVYMMSSCFTHCGTSNLSSLFYFANSNFIMPVNINILSFPSML